MNGDQWQKTELAAREANGRGDRELAIRLMAQSIEEARDPALAWNDLQSALAGGALFHDFITENFSLALEYYRESYAILIANIGADHCESKSFAEFITDCEAKLAASSS